MCEREPDLSLNAEERVAELGDIGGEERDCFGRPIQTY